MMDDALMQKIREAVRAFHVICWQGPEWCVPVLVVEGALKKANQLAEEMNSSPEAKRGLRLAGSLSNPISRR